MDRGLRYVAMTAVAPSSLFGNSTLSTVATDQRDDGQRPAASGTREF